MTVRDNRSGGVLIYYKESVLAHQVTTWDRPNLDATWLNVTVRSQSFLVGCIYRPPSDCSFFDDFRNQITEIWMKRKNIILVGDFNCDMSLPAWIQMNPNLENASKGFCAVTV